MSMQEMTAVIIRFQAATDALAALPRTTMRLRTIRDGGSMLDSGGAAALLRGAGCQDVHSLARTWPVPFGFVTGRRA
jgi:hypothetical protein